VAPSAVLGSLVGESERSVRCRGHPGIMAICLVVVVSAGDERGGQDQRAVRFHAKLGDQVRAHNLVRDADRDNFRDQLAGYFAGLDLLITPMLATPPVEAARWGQRSWPRVFAANVRYAPYAAPWNHAGYPAVSVPAGVHPGNGTPLGVQLVAPDGGEQLLLGVAAMLERLVPWPRVAPGT